MAGNNNNDEFHSIFNDLVDSAVIKDAAKAITGLYKAIKDEGVSSIEAMQILKIMMESGMKGGSK